MRTLITYAVVGTMLLTAGTSLAQQRPTRTFDTTNLSKSCNPEKAPTKAEFFRTYVCHIAGRSYACDVYLVAGDCFQVVVFDEKTEMIRIDAIKRGRQTTVWLKTTSR